MIHVKKRLVNSIFLISLFFISCMLSTPIIMGSEVEKTQEPFANLVLKTSGGGCWTNFALYIAQYLRDIGIEIEVKILEWSLFVGELIISHDYDLGITGIGTQGVAFEIEDYSSNRNFKGAFPSLSDMMRDMFTEDGYLNFFGLSNDMPYVNESNTIINDFVSTTDFDEKLQLYYDWQVLVMDKILPCLPLFSYRMYTSTWSNTEGYDVRWGITNSLPYMSFNGLHQGQEFLDEWNEADLMWSDLNPLLTTDNPSRKIWELCSEPIVQYSPDLAPLKTGLVYDWDKIDDCHYKFYMRDNVYWNPSYNVTERDVDSVPLADIPDDDLMIGLKGEYSNGTNQQVTAKDAVFTYCAWSNPNVSESVTYHDWINNIYVDPMDNLSFHIHIDANPETIEQDYYVDFWSRLPWNILPEFFLNSTNPVVTYTSGGVKNWGLYTEMKNSPAWEGFDVSCFGCGKFMLDYLFPHSVTVLQKSPYWFGVGAIDGTTGMTPFVETINLRVICDNTAELAEFKAGKLDIFMDFSQHSSERIQMQADARFTISTTIADNFDFLFFNLKRPFIGGENNYIWLTEPGKEEYTRGVAVRKAICYAIDREEINTVLADGENFVSHSIIYPYNTLYYYNDIEPKYSRNLELAQEWLGLPETTKRPYNLIFFLVYGLPILVSFIILVSIIVVVEKADKRFKKEFGGI